MIKINLAKISSFAGEAEAASSASPALPSMDSFSSIMGENPLLKIGLILLFPAALYFYEKNFISKSNREIDFLTLSATERYEKFLMDSPELVRRIPLYQLAKYLGVSSEALSRIRKKMTLTNK